ncbi:MAG: response regulator [Coriobacteriales bacterium]|nr:response regulator [Coriobacteriales bacterium]
MAEYVAGEDVCVRAIFERADQIMYQKKMLLKSLGAQTRGNEPNESAYDLDFDDIAALSMKRHLLIADDVATNREILGALLEDDYEILYASDGTQTLEMLRRYKDQIALLLLDLYMPNMTGREVLAEMQVDEDLMSIPVIVVTVDADVELDCLQIGAMDFIPKPYPDIEIVKARISQCIELSENRDLIRRTQRDRLTGLYNIEYFIRYVDRFDQTYEGAAPDAVVCDVVQFHEVNDRYGRQFGDLVLRSIGMSIGRLARRIGGIGCRKEGDTFLLYCPHQDDYEQLFARFVDEVFVEKETAGKVSLRFGVFVDARLEADIEERFVCARIAADSLEDNSNGMVGFYQYQGR